MAKTHPIPTTAILFSLAAILLCLGTIKAADPQEEKTIKERLNSMQHLRKLGTALLLYSGDNNETFPKNIEALKPYLDSNMAWILENVSYKKIDVASRPDTPMAFDKTMFSKESGTVVLFNDGHVEFVKPDRLEKLGIQQSFREPDAEKQEKNMGPIVLKVVGPDGESLAGAKVYQHYYLAKDGQQRGLEYVCDENGLVNLVEEKIFKHDWQKKNGVVLYGLLDNKLAGFLDLKIGDLGKEAEMKLMPACRVYGEIKSAELNNLGQEVNGVIAEIIRNNCSLTVLSKKGEFEFILPEGSYKLYVNGTRTYSRFEDINIAAGQKELEKNFDLPADRLAYLIGKQAPELQKMKGWLNSKPLSLKELRGKVVLLDFWGTWCGPCVQAIPKLIELHEKYCDKRLVIIGIHDDSMNSVKDLEKEIEKLSKERWDGKKIPFAIALDGGGRCKIEGTERTASGATTAAYGIQAWPTMVLINKQGKVVNDFYPDANNPLLEKLLAAEVNDTP